MRIDKSCWIFGFGSLIWLPGFSYCEALPARLYGWHRRFSLVSHLAWGTVDQPGVVAAAHRGGNCVGMAYRLRPHQHRQVIRYLKVREQAYRWITVPVYIGNRSVRALTFAFDPNHPRALSKLSPTMQLTYLNQGVGTKGSGRSYALNMGYVLRHRGQVLDAAFNRWLWRLGYCELLRRQSLLSPFGR